MKILNNRIHGGYSFTHYPQLRCQSITEFTTPMSVCIPLKQGFGGEVAPTVVRGERVTYGQIIGRSDSLLSSPVHASISGTVESIKSMPVQGDTVRCIILKNGTHRPHLTDDQEPFVDQQALSEQEEPVQMVPVQVAYAEEVDPAVILSRLNGEQIGEKLYASGASCCGLEGIPTQYKSSTVAPSGVNHIIVNLVEDEPYSPTPLISQELVLEHNFVSGLEILMKLMPNAQCHVIAGFRRKRCLKRLKSTQVGMKQVKLVFVPHKYPIHHYAMLLPLVVNQRLHRGMMPSRAGVIVLSERDVLQCYDAVILDKPFTHTIIKLCGPGFGSGVQVRVACGTAVEQVIKAFKVPHQDFRFIINSIMNGWTVAAKQVVSRDMHALFAIADGLKRPILPYINPGVDSDSFSRMFYANIFPTTKQWTTQLMGEQRPCIRCDYCSAVCPQRLYPQLLYHAAQQHGSDDYVVAHNITACIQCHLCTYVCPSKLAVSRGIQNALHRIASEPDAAGGSVLPE
ncbi:MAG: 4Fe-4S dicluster domain-containing protein [Chitinivibrionales bacterium]|nr:4Fe-4S dicluster domain-containing protein [Chitinivibrionales bacterium]